MANGLIAIGIVLGFGLAALAIPLPAGVPLPLAVVLGAALGLAVAVLLCGSAAILLQMQDQLAAAGAGAPVHQAPTAAATAAASAPAMNGAANDAAAVDPVTGLPVSADLNNLPPQVIEMLNDGRFAEFHLEKAKIAFANRDFKKAKYEVAASMCHDPANPEARRLRTEIRAAR
jgi:hypothetical protein